MELGKLAEAAKAHDEAVTRTVLDLEGEPILSESGEPCTIDVLGAESKAVRRAKAQIARKALKSRRRRGEADDLGESRRALACAALVGWSGFTGDGKDAPLTTENKMLFLSPKDDEGTVLDFTLQQVEEVMYDHAGFSRDSSQT